MERLTPNQLKVLQFIEGFIRWSGYAPTLDEIARQMSVSKPTVQQYLQALEQKRAIRRERYAHRSIEIVAEDDAARKMQLPLLGRIAAGEPIEKNRIRLQPANPKMKPMDAKEVVIQGVVRGVFRPVR